MKKGMFLFSIFILFISMVSASYNCSIGYIKNQRETIETQQVTLINGVNVVLIEARAGLSADVLIDAKRVTLTENTTTEVELLSGEYDLSYENKTANKISLIVDGKAGEVELERITKVNKLQIYITDFGSAINLFTGIDYFFFYGTTKSITKKINGIEYVFELISSSDSAAIINIGKCNNGSLIYINDSINIPLPVINTSQNDSLNSPTNDSQNDSSLDSSLNESQNDSSLDAENLEGKNKEAKGKDNVSPIYIIITVAISLVVIIILFLSYTKRKSNEVPIEPVQDQIFEEK